MVRFILLVFGFLALAFYEFSGGVNFDASNARMAAMAARQADETALAASTARARAQDEAVTRVELNLVYFDDVAGEDAVFSREDPPLQAVAAVATTAAVVPAPPDAEDLTLQAATALPNAAAPATVEAATSPETTAPAPTQTAVFSSQANAAPLVPRFDGSTTSATSDRTGTNVVIRQVNGDLVNLRAGPSTAYGVIGQLPRGAQVEVIGENGAGWVRLRPVNGGPEGWMADFLLTRG
ncbi:MAG: SH3 domain-containing protein [Pseudomonadota bacterium]